MSGADLEYQRMLAQAGVSIHLAQGYDAARLEQIIDILTVSGGGGGGDGSGRGINSISLTSSVDGVDTYTIYMSSPPNYTFTVTNGTDGTDGTSAANIVSLERTAGDGSPGTNDTWTFTYSDDAEYAFTVHNGADGVDAPTIVSLERTDGDGSQGTTDTWTFTYSDASTYDFTVYNGSDVSATSIRDFADWDDSVPTAEGYMPEYDIDDEKYVDKDPREKLAGVDGAQRLDPTNWPQFMPLMVALPEGSEVPAPLLAFVEGGYTAWVYDIDAPPSVTPVFRGKANSPGSSDHYVIQTTADILEDQIIAIALMCSAETTGTHLPPVVYDPPDPATGAWDIIATVDTMRSGSVQGDLMLVKCTTMIPEGTDINIDTDIVRIQKAGGLAWLPGVVFDDADPLWPPLDQAQESSGANSLVLDLAIPAVDTTTQDNIVGLALFCNNYGSGAVTRPINGTDGWLDLFDDLSTNASGGRYFRFCYKLFTAAGNHTASGRVNASDGNSGAWCGLSAFVKVAE